MADYLGDYRRSAILYVPWSSNNSLGAAVTPSSAGTVVVYKNNSTTETSVGVTAHTTGFDALVGINLITIDSSASVNFYAPGNDFHVMLSGASIDGAFVNAALGTFSIENRFMGEIRRASAQTSTSTTITLDASSSATNNWYLGSTIYVEFGTGAEQQREITSYTGSSKLALVDRAWTINPDSTSTFRVFPGSQGITLAEINNEVVDVVSVDVQTEPTAPPAATAAMSDKIDWIFAVLRNKVSQTSTVQLIRNDADTASIGTATTSDDGTTFLRGKYV
jgi:hypothetical protein